MRERNEEDVLALPEARGLDKNGRGGFAGAHVPHNGAGYGYGHAQEAEENHLREYLRAVRKHLWLILGLTLVAASLAAVYVARKPDIYVAGARVQVDLESNPGAGASKGGGTVVLSNATTDPAYFNTQIQNLTSQGLLRRVVKTLDLEHNQSFLRPNKNRRLSTWESLKRMVGLGDKKERDEPSEPAENHLPLTGGSVAAATAREDLVEAKRLEPFVRLLQSGLKVTPVKETRTSSYTKDTRLIDVQFTHTDPQLAAKIVNAIADTFVLSNLEKKTENTSSTGDFLQKRVAELQSQIRQGEERLVNYAKANQILSLDGTQNTVVERLAGLNRQLLEAENERKDAEAAYRAALSEGAAGALASKDAKASDDTEAKLTALRERRAQLLVDNTEEWPEVKEINQQIAVLEKQLAETKNRATSVVKTNLETRYRQAAERERSIRAAFDRQRGETVTQNEAAINYRIIQQEVETNKQLLDGLLQRSKENDVVMVGTPNNVSVVDYAVSPDYPVGPQRLRTVLMALFLGLAASIGLALLLEYLNDSVRSTEDVDRYVQLPAIGVIPSVGGGARRRLLPSSTALQRRGGYDSPELLVNVEARSALAESYRHLRTQVMLSRAGQAPQVLLVTSSTPSEGKTTTAVNTALVLAQREALERKSNGNGNDHANGNGYSNGNGKGNGNGGGRILIVDADMRRPRVHSIFGLSNRHGLSNILSNHASEAEAFDMIVRHEESGLDILPAGLIPPNPAELIGSDEMDRLMATLRRNYKHVVIDSPPAISFADAIILSTKSDGVMLVVRSGKTPRGIVRRTRQFLQDVGANVFGVVLNGVHQRENDYYYYGGYYSKKYYDAPDVEAEPVA